VGDEEFGVASGGTNNTLTDSTKSWNTNEWAGGYIMVFRGELGTDEYWVTKEITSNSSNSITTAESFSYFDEDYDHLWVWNWDETSPDDKCRYVLVKESKLFGLYDDVYMGLTEYLNPNCTTVRKLWAWCEPDYGTCYSGVQAIRSVLTNSGVFTNFIEIPSLFGDGAFRDTEFPGVVAIIPGMVNLLNKNGALTMPYPYGPHDENGDVFVDYVIQNVSASFIDDWPLHDGYGEVHCGTNAKREIPDADWWDPE
jgi:protein-arginine deiminase